MAGCVSERTPRTAQTGGRSQEIQRLIGRSLRAVTDLKAFGERLILVDCDVIEADGGTRTAAINGALVALHDAFVTLSNRGQLLGPPLRDAVAQSEAPRDDETPRLEKIRASIGASGIGFVSSRAVPVGTAVAVHVVLLPQRESIIAGGRISQSRSVDGGDFLGVEFVDLADEDQRRLTRHVLRAEISRRK